MILDTMYYCLKGVARGIGLFWSILLLFLVVGPVGACLVFALLIFLAYTWPLWLLFYFVWRGIRRRKGLSF